MRATKTLRLGSCRTYTLLSLLCFSVTAAEETHPVVRVGALQFGTVNWELDVIKTHGIDTAEEIAVKTVPLASKSATHVALQGGAADVIVSDWIWVSRQRAAGRDYTFVPYSLSVGALMVRPNSGLRTLDDLKDKRLGIAGGPLDKSWLLLRAYARKHFENDALESVEPVFAAPPLLSQFLLSEQLPAILTFWHYAAQLEAVGMQPMLKVADLLARLGVHEPVPLVGWVFDARWANEHRDAITGLLRASYAAKRLLEESDAEWERIRPLTGAPDETTLRALRDAYRAGIPRTFGEKEKQAAVRVYAILAAEGGERLVGSASALSPGTFWDGYQVKPWK